MKKLALIALCLLVVAMFATAVTAVSVQETFSSSAPTLGGKSQESSNPEHDDEDKQNVLDDVVITLVNSDMTSHIINTISFSPNGFSSSDINLTSNANGKTLSAATATANSTLQITISGRIPETLDAIDSNFNEIAFKVATATITYTDASTPTVFDIYMQRENVININDAKVETNNRDRKNLDDSDDVKNIKPGDILSFDIEAENTASKKSNLEVNDAQMDFTCDDEDDIDINDDDNEQDISEDEKQTYTFEVEFNEDAKDGSIKCTLAVDGDDVNGARHGNLITFDLKVERENHDISVRDVTIAPQDITCSDKSFQVAIDLLNLGTSNEDEAAVEIEGRTLNFLKKISNLELDEDDSSTEVFDIPVPDGLAAGAHVLQVRTFYDNTKASDSEIIQINNLCGTVEAEEPAVTDQPAVMVSKTSYTSQPGSLVSIPVKITNTMTGMKTYMISFENGEDFAQPVTEKTVSLNSGQTSTVFLNVRLKEDATMGEYSAAINVASSGKIVGSETVTVKVEGQAQATPATGDFVGSTGFWVLIDVLLIVAVIVILWFIFRKREE
ncbi:MAG TPA: hypothetical protein VJB87_05240 [Candidatus Nanoarchaeia archaeon]|nr:hypothetical protein [Candidatus Nanoarchaeia archaeon]